jgi:hypothetical protein
MTGDENIWEGIEFEINEPRNTFELPFVDSIFQHSDGYQSDALSEYNDELQPSDRNVTISVPEEWIKAMNSPAISVMSAELHSPVIPFELEPTGMNSLIALNSGLDPNDTSNYTFGNFVSQQNWYEPNHAVSSFGDTSFQSFPCNSMSLNSSSFFHLNAQDESNQNSSQFDLESLGFQNSQSASIDFSNQQQHHQYLVNASKVMNSPFVTVEPPSPLHSGNSAQSFDYEQKKTKGDTFLPDGRFWNMIKSNGSILYGCPWEGCGKSMISIT